MLGVCAGHVRARGAEGGLTISFFFLYQYQVPGTVCFLKEVPLPRVPRPGTGTFYTLLFIVYSSTGIYSKETRELMPIVEPRAVAHEAQPMPGNPLSMVVKTVNETDEVETMLSKRREEHFSKSQSDGFPRSLCPLCFDNPCSCRSPNRNTEARVDAEKLQMRVQAELEIISRVSKKSEDELETRLTREVALRQNLEGKYRYARLDLQRAVAERDVASKATVQAMQDLHATHNEEVRVLQQQLEKAKKEGNIKVLKTAYH